VNEQGGQFQHFTTKEGLSHDWVNAIIQDGNDILWFGTWGGGITMFDPETKKVKYYTTKEGLSSNIIWTMEEDKEGRIWVATENGLSLFVPLPSKTNSDLSPFGEFKILTYGKADGLKTIIFEGNSVDLTSKNEIWWGGGYNGGLTSLDLNHFQLPERIPDVFLTTIDVNQQSIDYNNLNSTKATDLPFVESLREAVGAIPDFSNYPVILDLPYQLNHLTFHFSAIDWQAPHKLKYSYRLAGTKEDWSPVSSSTIADYRNLGHGNYTFQVKAMGIAQEWSEPMDYSFTIRPPWWHTWWARLIYVAMSVTLLYGFIQWRLAKLKKERNDKMAFAEALIVAQEKERKRIARDLHDGIGQSLLLIKKELDSNHKVTRENQQLITETLEEVRSISHDLHPFQLEKFGLTAAIEEVITKIEKSTDLFISKEIENIDKTLTAKGEINLFRTIQESFNNIVKHAEATAAKISIYNEGLFIIVKIQDNGKGFDHELAISTSKSLGLKTMLERIAAIGGQLKMEKGTPKGTIILIRIPKMPA
jgi:signal transduction histidine kinase